MSKHLIIILLIISLAFNLAVLGMFIYATAFHKRPFFHPGIEKRMDDRHFNRDRSNRMSMDSLFTNKEEIKQLRQDFNLARKDFIQTMTKDNFNEQEALAAMQRSLAAQEILERKLGSSLMEVRKKMTPDEAKKFFEHRLNRMDRKIRYRTNTAQDNKYGNDSEKQGDQRR